MRKRVLEEKYLETIRIHRSEIKNIVFKDKGKEFLYNGEMYDIKSRSQEGDFIAFRCINDKTEKQLRAGLDHAVKHNSDSNSSQDKKQGSSSKNPVKDLFCHNDNMIFDISTAFVFPFAIFNFTSHIPPALPLPPPEGSFS